MAVSLVAATERTFRRHAWVERGTGAALTMWMVGVLAVFWPALRYPVFISDSNIDASFFGYAGELVRRGGVPYLTFWDHKPPLIFYIDGAALFLSGGRLWGLWLASLATVLGAMLLGYRALWRAYGTAPALVGLTAFVCALSRVLPVNMTEGYVLPVVWATALLLLATASSGAVLTRALACGAGLGALGALAFFLRANTIGAGLAAFIVLTVVLLRGGHVGAWLRLVAGGAIGAVVVTLLVIAPLARAGALGAFWDQAFHYNFLYARAGLGLRVRAGLYVMTDVFAYGTLILPMAGWAAAVGRTWEERDAGLRVVAPLLAVVWPPLEVVLATTSGRSYGHYFAVVMPAMAYLMGFAAWALLHRLTAFGTPAVAWGRRVIVVVMTAVGGLTALGTALRLRDRESPRTRYEQVAATSALIRASTPPNATVLVWGHASDVYYMAQRQPASRFVYPLALLTPGYADSALVRGFLAELRAAAPPLIIDATAGATAGEALVPSLATWDPAWHYPTMLGAQVRWWTMTPALREFYDYVRQEYAPAGFVGAKHWTVYRRLSTAATTAQVTRQAAR